MMKRLKGDIDELRERLRKEASPNARRSLQRLLLDELYRIGFSRELIEFFDRKIEGWKEWINRQRSVVERLELRGFESPSDRKLLALAQETLTLHELHRRRILRIMRRGRGYF